MTDANHLGDNPLPKVDDPIKFLSSLNMKTKKTPLEMKREAEGVFQEHTKK